MKIDAISIFPEFFDVLGLSLLGKAQDQKIIGFEAHDLRKWTSDKHRTVDDSPYGGGAGMVMKPEPWGDAFDEIIPKDQRPTIIFTTPAGIPFTRSLPPIWPQDRTWFCLRRYEGIDQECGSC